MLRNYVPSKSFPSRKAQVIKDRLKLHKKERHILYSSSHNYNNKSKKIRRVGYEAYTAKL